MKVSRQVKRANRFRTSFAQTRAIRAPRSERRQKAREVIKELSLIDGGSDERLSINHNQSQRASLQASVEDQADRKDQTA